MRSDLTRVSGHGTHSPKHRASPAHTVARARHVLFTTVALLGLVAACGFMTVAVQHEHATGHDSGATHGSPQP